MSLEWKTVELKSIANVTMGQSPKSEFYNDNFEGMPFLQGNKTFGDKYPSFELYTTSIKKVAEKSSVLMSVRAPVGDLNIAKEDICIGRGVCGLQMKKGDNEFLYYLLKANISHLINKESGTVFGSINKNDIETFEVTLPENFEDQMKILTILKNIDKKIEVCKELNKSLGISKNMKFFNNFKNPKGRLGKFILNQMNDKNSQVSLWGINHFQISQNDIIIDIGCGGGVNINQMKRHSPKKIYGVDISEESVKKAREFTNEEIIKADVEKLPFDDSSADIITAFKTVFFWKDLNKAFREVRRVLKDGGIFVIVADFNGEENTTITKLMEMDAKKDSEITDYLIKADFSKVTSYIRDVKEKKETVKINNEETKIIDDMFNGKKSPSDKMKEWVCIIAEK